MAKKGENIYQRADGRWEGRYISGYDAMTGKAQYGYVYAASYSEVKRRKRTIEKEMEQKQQQEKLKQRRLTVAECFEEWMAWKSTDPTLHQSTLDQYRRHLDKHILPELGRYKMCLLNSRALDQFRMDKLEHGRLDGTGGLSISMVNTLMFVVYSMLDYALEERYIGEIPRKKKRRIKRGEREVRVFSKAEQDRIESVLFNCFPRPDYGETCVGIFFALYTGLRIGELAGLKWRDIDLAGSKVFVRRTLQRGVAPKGSDTKTSIYLGPPKSRNSQRTFPIKQELCEMMRAYYETRPEDRRYPDSAVFSVEGKHIEPRVYQKRLKWVLRKAGVEEANFHALRHTFATRCIERNMDIQSLSECLGHSSGTITLDVYAHSFADHKRSCVNRLDFPDSSKSVSFSKRQQIC